MKKFLYQAVLFFKFLVLQSQNEYRLEVIDDNWWNLSQSWIKLKILLQESFKEWWQLEV